jgi:hypothetical protein
MIRFTSRIDGGVTIRFAEKPPAEILAMLKANGFRWFRRRIGEAADFLLALERRCNPGRPDGACWKCNSPEGFFRPCGAATPVYCDACWKALNRPDRSDLDYEDQCARACGLL